MEETQEKPRRNISELVAVCEALIFVADEPLPVRSLIKILQEDSETITAALEQLQSEYEERESGLQIREIGGGWQISTRTEFHEEVREFFQ